MSGHSIKLYFDRDGVNGEFHCHEEAGAWCRQTCSHRLCEVWDDDCVSNHGMEATEFCNPVVFVENAGYWYETFLGADDQLYCEPRSGPIVFEWQGDWYGWRYADEEPHRHVWPDWGTRQCVHCGEPQSEAAR